MKILFFILLFTTSAFALPVPTTDPYPTEELASPLPGTIPSEASTFDQLVENADKVLEDSDKNEAAPPKKGKRQHHEGSSRENRANSFGSLMIGYQLISSWVPSKKTISYTQIFNDNWSLEGEYSFSTLDFPIASIDLGAITERRFSLMAKRYMGNSFYTSFGAIFNDFEAEAGNDILDNVAGTRTTSSFGVEGVGITGSIGNRWQWNNGFTLGVDWFRLNIPIAITKVDSEILSSVTQKKDAEEIREAIKKFGRIPTFVLFGLNLGYTF